VFRTPVYPAILSSLCGVGAQGIFMATVIIVTTMFGLVNPYLRWWMSIQSFFVLAMGGFFNGYISSRMMKFFGSGEWKFSANASAMLFPFYMFSMFVLVEIIEWLERSSSYVPFTTALGLSFIWVLFTIPMAYMGAYAGFVKTEQDKPPCKVSSVRRRVPSQSWYLDIKFLAAISGLAIFGTIFGEF
jgi:transmembrane 9 superfamily member 2/4